MFDSFFFCKVPFSSGIQGRNRQIQNFYMKNFSDFPSKILDIIFLRCDNKTVERFQTSHNFIKGLVAQLGAHHIRIVGVVGSNPIRSIKNTIRFPDGVFVITYHLCYFCSIGIFYGTKKLFTPATSPSASLPNVASSWAEAPSPSSISILGIVE